ncbi:MAG: hypothetical protein ACM37W_19760 [Actinomycetota bacterium]
MTPNDHLTDTYGQLMVISQRMLQSGHYEVAFHSLEAAFHCADDLKDEQRLIAVQREAERQRDFIDAEAPTHRMSTQTANQRGGQNMYSLLIRQANVPLNQIKHNRRQQQLGLPKQ